MVRSWYTRRGVDRYACATGIARASFDSFAVMTARFGRGKPSWSAALPSAPCNRALPWLSSTITDEHPHLWYSATARRAQSSGCIRPDRSSSTARSPRVSEPIRMPVSSPLPVSSVTAGSIAMARTSTSVTGFGSVRSVHARSS